MEHSPENDLNTGAYRALVASQHKEIIHKLSGREKVQFLRQSLYEWMMISAAIAVIILTYYQYKDMKAIVYEVRAMAASAQAQHHTIKMEAESTSRYRAQADRDFNDAVNWDQRMQIAREKREIAREKREIAREKEMAELHQMMSELFELHNGSKN